MQLQLGLPTMQWEQLPVKCVAERCSGIMGDFQQVTCYQELSRPITCDRGRDGEVGPPPPSQLF